MKPAISVKSPFSHNALFEFMTVSSLCDLELTGQPSAVSSLQYNCAVRLLEEPCPSVSMTCSNALRMQYALHGSQETLQKVQGTEWMHSPRF
jgi:hypothetical protein